MLDNGKGDRPAESSGVKVSVGWVEAQSDPAGRRANRQAVVVPQRVRAGPSALLVLAEGFRCGRAIDRT
jgi:hypothetical protein